MAQSVQAGDGGDPAISRSEVDKPHTVVPGLVAARSVAREPSTTRRFILMYGVLVAAFLFLAWRSETNENAIRDGLYEACMSRHDTAIEFNKGREALVQLVVNAPNRELTPEAKALAIKQLRDGLLLPVEPCQSD